MIWTINEADEKQLDKYENAPELYRKEYVYIDINGEKTKALIYIMNDGFELALPSERYFNEVLDGYTENNLETEPLFQAMFDVKNVL